MCQHTRVPVLQAMAERLGYTVPIQCDAAGYSMLLLVQPDTDYDDVFKAYDPEDERFRFLNGWLWDIEPA